MGMQVLTWIWIHEIWRKRPHGLVHVAHSSSPPDWVEVVWVGVYSSHVQLPQLLSHGLGHVWSLILRRKTTMANSLVKTSNCKTIS